MKSLELGEEDGLHPKSGRKQNILHWGRKHNLYFLTQQLCQEALSERRNLVPKVFGLQGCTIKKLSVIPNEFFFFASTSSLCCNPDRKTWISKIFPAEFLFCETMSQ